MKISVKVKTRAREEQVLPQTEAYVVHVKEPPTDDRANKAVIRLLAAHFDVTKQQVRIVSGHTATRKIVEIVR